MCQLCSSMPHDQTVRLTICNEYVGVINSSIKKKDTTNEEENAKKMNYENIDRRWYGGKKTCKQRNYNKKTHKRKNNPMPIY